MEPQPESYQVRVEALPIEVEALRQIMKKESPSPIESIVYEVYKMKNM